MSQELWMLLFYAAGTITGIALAYKFFLMKGAEMTLDWLVDNSYIKYKMDSDGEIHFYKVTDRS